MVVLSAPILAQYNTTAHPQNSAPTRHNNHQDAAKARTAAEVGVALAASSALPAPARSREELQVPHTETRPA
eukprot:1617184-Amphidinium_carterae.1